MFIQCYLLNDNVLWYGLCLCYVNCAMSLVMYFISCTQISHILCYSMITFTISFLFLYFLHINITFTRIIFHSYWYSMIVLYSSIAMHKAPPREIANRIQCRPTPSPFPLDRLIEIIVNYTSILISYQTRSLGTIPGSKENYDERGKERRTGK